MLKKFLKIDMLKINYVIKQEYSYVAKNLRTHEHIHFTDYRRYIEYLIHFHHYDILSLALIPV